MNIASLATFSLYYSPHCKKASHIVALGHKADRENMRAFERMVRAWSWVESVSLRFIEDSVDLGDVKGAVVVILALGQPEGLRVSANTPVVVACVPAPTDDSFGFFQEVESHDYELGGVNEWNESAGTSFSPSVLQSLSAAHVHRMMPSDVWPEIEAHLRRIKPEGRISCLDVGCGPISKLRAVAISGLLEIVGVDPLNDLYASVIARHGYDGLPKIRPDVSINGFAEEIDFGDRKFDFVFSLNALDHTQDLEQSISSMVNVLADNGLIFIKVYTREGERQNYAGLHKFNMWSEAGDVLFNTRDTAPKSIRTISPQLDIAAVYTSSPDELAFSLTKKAALALASTNAGGVQTLERAGQLVR